MLHPIMPFVTEHLWKEISFINDKSSKKIIHARWPKIDIPTKANTRDADKLIQIISAIRSARAELNVPIKSLINIKYTANQTQLSEIFNDYEQSVRTYGTWTGTNISTGKELNLKGYWYMNFDTDGKIIAQGDFFDFGGMYDAVYPKTKIFAKIDVKKGKAQEMLDVFDSKGGLPTTRAYDGCISLELAINEESNTIWIIGNWESFDKYNAYLKWRQTEDTVIGKMVPYLKGGEKGLKIIQPNANYKSY